MQYSYKIYPKCHRIVCDMWSGLIMSSSVVSFRFAPRRFASPRSLLDRLQNCKS